MIFTKFKPSDYHYSYHNIYTFIRRYISFKLIISKPAFSINIVSLIFVNLFFVTFIANSDSSIPIHFLPKLCADFKIVPEPQKQSKTMLSLFEEVFINLSLYIFLLVHSKWGF